MERIEIRKEIIQDVINNNKIGAIKKLRKKGFSLAIAHKIALELSIIIKTEQITEVNDEIVKKLNAEINREKRRLLAPVGTSI